MPSAQVNSRTSGKLEVFKEYVFFNLTLQFWHFCNTEYVVLFLGCRRVAPRFAAVFLNNFFSREIFGFHYFAHQKHDGKGLDASKYVI